MESGPGKVEKFHSRDTQTSHVSFEWVLPSIEQNGVIHKFTIAYGLECSTHTHTQVNNFKPTGLYGTIKMLIPRKSYIFHIQAETKIGCGPEAIWKQKMPILRDNVYNYCC